MVSKHVSYLLDNCISGRSTPDNVLSFPKLGYRSNIEFGRIDRNL